jgi:hypothetical protein
MLDSDPQPGLRSFWLAPDFQDLPPGIPFFATLAAQEALRAARQDASVANLLGRPSSAEKNFADLFSRAPGASPAPPFRTPSGLDGWGQSFASGQAPAEGDMAEGSVVDNTIVGGGTFPASVPYGSPGHTTFSGTRPQSFADLLRQYGDPGRPASWASDAPTLTAAELWPAASIPQPGSWGKDDPSAAPAAARLPSFADLSTRARVPASTEINPFSRTWLGETEPGSDADGRSETTPPSKPLFLCRSSHRPKRRVGRCKINLSEVSRPPIRDHSPMAHRQSPNDRSRSCLPLGRKASRTIKFLHVGKTLAQEPKTYRILEFSSPANFRINHRHSNYPARASPREQLMTPMNRSQFLSCHMYSCSTLQPAANRPGKHHLMYPIQCRTPTLASATRGRDASQVSSVAISR